VRRGGYPIEVQLRTVLQDAWANQVEEDGRQIGVGLKFGAGATEIHAYYIAISDAFALLDRGEPLSKEMETTLNAQYAKIRETLPRENGTTP
jgi:ppGpp synthetase/RelA/SpoT-type nucleotidyltranferase